MRKLSFAAAPQKFGVTGLPQSLDRCKDGIAHSLLIDLVVSPHQLKRLALARGGHVSSHSSRPVIAAAKTPITTQTARTAQSSPMVLHGKLNSMLPYFMATPPISDGSAHRNVPTLVERGRSPLILACPPTGYACQQYPKAG